MNLLNDKPLTSLYHEDAGMLLVSCLEAVPQIRIRKPDDSPNYDLGARSLAA
jgi:hypothetical protein